uniref:uncharacterized protein LOC122608276 n=1 Tax=Erigeron canadensis TaxID=72917 RepID=UPI001CB98631|nr:uncharacterized protein LOC122608276 [Erigeron canadensis]
MEEMSSLWSHQETIEELKLRIHYTTLELEAVRAKANEEVNKSTESVKQMLQLLKLVCQERDEARNRIHRVLNKIMPSINNPMSSDFFMINKVNHCSLNPNLMKPAKANSSIAESNSFSDAYNHSLSPVESRFDPVTSPEFSNINTNSSFVQGCCRMGRSDSFHALGNNIPKVDPATLMIENMIKGKALPQKGKLLRAVMEAGPLLQTLVETGPLPSCQNFSSPMQSFSVGGQNQTTMITKQSQPPFEISCYGLSKTPNGGGGVGIGGNILSFDDVNYNHHQRRMVVDSPRVKNKFGLAEKRQRIQ